jgi:hypothetical protein
MVDEAVIADFDIGGEFEKRCWGDLDVSAPSNPRFAHEIAACDIGKEIGPALQHLPYGAHGRSYQIGTGNIRLLD